MTTWRGSIDTTASELLSLARQHAQAARFDDLAAIGRRVIEHHGHDLVLLLDTGVLLLNFGFHSLARDCFDRAFRLDPSDLRAVVNLANLARDLGGLRSGGVALTASGRSRGDIRQLQQHGQAQRLGAGAVGARAE
ncbi:hypothetical protein [Imhoffiella purpurea]|uniref:hypothetical protein n=1 Tax=Imhoffiella purpurea TaxID=1249627 RepID=UPI0018DF31B1|nr:hypothetical protein [Imhoffiella purpurea]